MEHWFIPYQATELPKAKRALVLAPHPDDEIFGCGGALALLRLQESSVEVVVLTDGAGWEPDSHRQKAADVRQSETNASLAMMGVGPAEYWGIVDRGLVSHPGLSERIAERLRGVDLVFAPALTEVHPDHVATGRAVIAALQSLDSQKVKRPCVFFYEVGAPVAPNFLLDITPVWHVKKAAMLCFQSQQNVQDYARHIEGLNTFRTYSLPAHIQYAEAYYCLSSDWLPNLAGQNKVPTRLSGRTPQDVEQIIIAAESMAEDLYGKLLTSKRQFADVNEDLQEMTKLTSHFKATLQQEQKRYERDVAELRGAIQALELKRANSSRWLPWWLTRPMRALRKSLGKP